MKQSIFFLMTIIMLTTVVSEAEDFFPIGMFSVGPENLGTVKEAGFNTAHTYLADPVILQKYIEIAEKTGIKLLMYPSVGAEKGVADLEKVRGFIERNRGTKSVLAWFIADEPDLNGGNPAQIKEIHSFIKKLYPSRPTAIVIHRTDRFKEYRDASDVLMIDRYPVPGAPLNHVAEATRWAGVQKGESGPVWTIIQAFGYQNPQLKGWGVPREPTYDEMRAMTFLSIIYGAKGIFYFTFTGSQYWIMESPQHWNDLKRIVRELNGIYPLLLTRGDSNNVKVEIIEGPQKDDRGLLPVHNSEKQLMKDTGEFKAGRYLIAASSTDKNVKTRFYVSDLSQMSVVIDCIAEKRDVKFDNGAFSDDFKTHDVHVYRVRK